MKILLWMYVCKVLICMTHGLCNNWILDMKSDVVPILKIALFTKLMIQWHIPIILIEAENDLIGYRPSMLRGMDVFPTLCYYDTQGCGRVVLRHDPQLVVMTTVGFLLGEVRFARLANTIALRLLEEIRGLKWAS